MNNEVSRSYSIPLMPLMVSTAPCIERNASRTESTLTNRLHQAESSMRATGNQLLVDVKESGFMQAIGAIAGHAVQQLITCGATTFAREQVFMHAYHAMLPVIEKKAAPALIAAQVAISTATIGSHFYREARLQDPHQEDAVRGHFGLNKPAWDSMLIAKQAKLTAKHKKASRIITHTQAIAEAIFLVISALNLRYGDGALASQVLSIQMRNMTYAVLRETAQASVSLVASKNGEPTEGVNSKNMKINAVVYTTATLAMGYLQDFLIEKSLPAGQSVVGPALRSNCRPLTGDELNYAINLVASIRGLANTGVEFMDAFLGKHFDVKQVGDAQTLQRNSKKMFPLKDYERLLDHSFVRMSWNNISGAVPLSINLLTKGKVDTSLSQFLSNAGSAAMFGLTYLNTNQIYQAHAKTRASRAAVRTGQPQSAGAQAGVNMTSYPPTLPIIDREAADESALRARLRASFLNQLNLATLSSSSNFPVPPLFEPIMGEAQNHAVNHIQTFVKRQSVEGQRTMSTASPDTPQQAATQLYPKPVLHRSNSNPGERPTAEFYAVISSRRALSLGSEAQTVAPIFKDLEETKKS